MKTNTKQVCGLAGWCHSIIMDPDIETGVRIRACQLMDMADTTIDSSEPKPTMYDVIDYCSSFGKCWKCGCDEQACLCDDFPRSSRWLAWPKAN